MADLLFPRIAGRARGVSSIDRDRVAALVLAAVLALFLAIAWWRQRFELGTALPALAALGGVLYLCGWWTRRRALALTLTLDVVLIFAYLWSLDDRVHVVITVTASGYVARVGNDVAILQRPVRAGRIGLYSGDLGSYRVQPTGEAIAPDAQTLLERFGDFVRLAEPKPAWENLAVSAVSSGGRGVSASLAHFQTMDGSWSFNQRGELEGSLNSNAFVGAAPARGFTVSADLMRGDGTQGIVVGVDQHNHGYLFAPRLDQPDALWFDWSNGAAQGSISGTTLHVPLLAVIQRDVRIFLGNAIVGLLLAALAPFLYLLFGAFLLLVGGSRDDDAVPFAELEDQPRLADGAALVAALVAVLATALIATQLLQAIPHVQDDVADLFQAKTLALGRLSVPTPRLSSFFTEEFIPMYHGRWFSKYPPGWPLLLSVGVLLRVPWLINPLLAGADLLLLYSIGREVYGRGVALVATLLALSSPFFLFLAGSYMSHTSELFYLSGFAYLLIRWARRLSDDRTPSRRDRGLLLGAGLLLGMAAITRQLDAVAFALPFCLLLVRRPWVRMVRPALLLGGGAAIPLVGLLLNNWMLTGSPLTSPYSLWWPFDRIGFGSTIGHGHTPANGFWNLSYNLEMLQAHLFGWPFFFTLALALLPFLLGRANRWDALFGASALSVMVAYVFYWHPGVMYGPRYYYVAIPWFALLTARGVQDLYHWPLRLPWRFTRDRLAALMVPLWLVGLLLAYDLTVYLPTQIPMYRGYNFTSADQIQAVQRAGLHHALVFVQADPAQWYSYGAVFSSNSPELNGDVVYARDQGKQDAALMRLYPHRGYYRLSGTTLQRLPG